MMDNNNSLPTNFIERIKRQIEDWSDFENVIQNGDSPVSIRLNKNKLPNSYNFSLDASVKWNSDGRYLNQRPSFKNDPLFQAGCYYPMEASSMFLEHALNQITLDQQAIILDLCAAPGGKSLIIKDHFPNNPLVSNEIDGKRVHILKENVVKWGRENHLVIQSDAKKLGESGLKFDLILVDAPCSGEGLFRKDVASRNEWSLERASGCAVRQQSILEDVTPMLAHGGYLIYSTCTYNQEENDERVAELLEDNLFELVTIQLEDHWNINRTKYGCQFWPHHLEGEGFYIAILKFNGVNESCYNQASKKNKRDSRIVVNSDLIPDNSIIQVHEQKVFSATDLEMGLFSALDGHCKFIRKSLFMGELKGNELIPSHDFAMSSYSSRLNSSLELDEENARKYLSGQALNVSCNKGPILLKHKGVVIGIGKSNGQRVNNLLPKHLRINF